MIRPHPQSRYPADWQAIAQAVKDAAGWCCIRCGHPHDVATGHVLTVHHLDGDKANCRWWNLTALCQRCHLQVQGKVKMDQIYMHPHSDWFRPYAAGFYAFTVLGLDLSRAEVDDRIAELLALGQPWLYPGEEAVCAEA
jgi:5-methylcytosine-specific restriction endonuclease McrA